MREHRPRRPIVFSRDELKRHEMRQQFPGEDKTLRHFFVHAATPEAGFSQRLAASIAFSMSASFDLSTVASLSTSARISGCSFASISRCAL